MNTHDAEILASAKFDTNGLIPAVLQDAHTREVLTVAYMNREALELTLSRRETFLYSRSRQKLWHKGETSGHFQKVQDVRLDCDQDTVLVDVEPLGPACHTGAYSCFNVEPTLDSFLNDLYALIERRRQERPDGSYTTYLFNSGLDKILKKLGEETTETVVAAKNTDPERVVSEASDLVYHLLVLLVEKNIPLAAIREELRKRHAGKSGKG